MKVKECLTAQEKILWSEYQQTRSLKDRNRLVEFYLPMVDTVIRRHRKKMPRIMQMIDARAAASIGLIQAVERFDLSRQVKFNTFAMPRLVGAILDAIRQWRFIPRSAADRGVEDPVFCTDPTYEATAKEPPTDRLPEFEFITRGLSVQERTAIWLYFVDGLKMREVGVALGISESRVSQLVSKALGWLRDLGYERALA